MTQKSGRSPVVVRQILGATFLTLCCLLLNARAGSRPLHQVNIDYQMAEKAIDWLEYVKAGATETEMRDYFMKHVAPTDGCKSIIRHWARFMEWDNDRFYTFILEGLGRLPGDGILTKEDGTLTGLGRRRMFWTAALENPQLLRDDLAALKNANLADSATALAAAWLPDSAQIKANFYLVLFGGSNAYSVGDVNGFDLLQMPSKSDGTLDLEDALCTFGHELHHTGFSFCNEAKITDKNRFVAVLAAEGLPTHCIDRYPERLASVERSQGKSGKDIATVWHSHEARLPELYKDAEKDIRSCLENGGGTQEMFNRWMGGLKGPAYVLGADMVATIDKYLGPDSIRAVAGDFRLFLLLYNQAAELANKSGEHRFVFDPDVVEKIGTS